VYKMEETRCYKCITNICYFSNKWQLRAVVHSYKRYEPYAAIILLSCSD